jgi:hypothetical protein
MSTTVSPKREYTPKRSKTADSSSNRNSRQPVDLRPTTPRLPFAPPTRATRLYRHNKLYRCPPTPPPEVQYNRERSFILDGKAVSNISSDYSTANPKLGSAIPPYVAQFDPSVDNYFEFFGVNNTLQKTGQVNRKDFRLNFHFVVIKSRV